jgi:type II secretory ATPase GspE/PulE/Tfp pilus assembly ATPase PilB-like protein
MTDTPVDRSEEFRLHELVNMPAEEAVTMLLQRAAELRSSDLFIMSENRYVTIAVRRLGMVEKLAVVSVEQGRQLISHIKANSRMDIAERRRPLDGRWIQELDSRRLDMRLSTVPTLHGEDLTIRLWDHSLGMLDLERLGMSRTEQNKLVYLLNHPSGLLLVTGPTGTGKTTTLYACLKYLNDGTRKINTLEDPIEYALEGVRQSQTNAKLGLDFPELLRSVLRQAPDIIMVGEIRDKDTATTAVRAANSGHLVLATLHSPTAAGAVQSLVALGAHPYFLSGCLLGTIAQRLVRTLCPKCRVRYDISESPDTFRDIEDLLESGEGTAIYGPGGCDECFQVGYTARTGLFEILTVNQEIRRLVARGAASHEIEQVAVRSGLVVFRRGALLKVARGVTSTEEILRDVPAEQLGLED